MIEKLILDGLKHCASESFCDTCPYSEVEWEDGEPCACFKDAIELIDSYIPRRLELEEISFYERPIWIEDLVQKALSEWGMYDARYNTAICFKTFGRPLSKVCVGEKYGVTWVCWSDRPREGADG